MDHLLVGAITAIHSRPDPRSFTFHTHRGQHIPLARVEAHRYFRILGIRIHPHLRPQGPSLDYVGLFLFAILSGIGFNGFGEVALLGAGVYVANHNLPIEPVLLIAWLGAMSGGIIGWVPGRLLSRFADHNRILKRDRLGGGCGRPPLRALLRGAALLAYCARSLSLTALHLGALSARVRSLARSVGQAKESNP